MAPDRVGPATVEAHLEWYFGDATSKLASSQELLSLRAVPLTPEPACTGTFCCIGASRANPMAAAGELTMGGLMLGGLWFLGRRRRH